MHYFIFLNYWFYIGVALINSVLKWLSYTYTWTCSFSNPFPILLITEHWAEFPVLSSRSLLVLHVKHSSVSMSIPNSLTIPSPSFPLVTLRLLQSIEQSSLCWTAGPCWLSIVFWFFLVWLQGMWALSSPTKVEPPSPALVTRSLNQ